MEFVSNTSPSSTNVTKTQTNTGLGILGTQILSSALHQQLYIVIEIITGCFVFLGPFTNTANILVFRRLGFASVSNISLTFLSAFDLLTSVLIAFILLTRTNFFELTISVAAEAIAVMTGPVFYSSTAISCWTTCVISMERCCCIMFPMKVKLIFTRRTVIILLMWMPVYQIATLIPNFIYSGLLPYTSPLTNRTIYIFDWTKYDNTLRGYLIFFSYSIPSIICLFLVTAGTILLVVKLQESAEFRQASSATAGNHPEKTSTKEKSLERSVIGICVIFFVCMTPNVLVYLVGVAYPEFNLINPVYGNLASFATFIGIFFQAVSASINVFVYLRMMRQYRETFKKIFYFKRKSPTRNKP